MVVRLGLPAAVRPSAADHNVERNSSTVLANAIDDSPALYTSGRVSLKNA